LQLNQKSIAAIVAVVLAGLVGGGYFIVKKQAENAPLRGPAQGQGRPGDVSSVRSLPVGVPGVPLEGKLGLADSPAKFAQFRIGNKNVKSIFVDGKIVWVGTSGGVIRYDSTTDNYKLYDNSNGLISNGIFYVGRIKGQIAVGTYGGGLSFLNEQTGQWKNYNIPEGLGDAFVYDVIEMKNGDVWIATWSGANRIRGGAIDDRSKWDLYTVENTKGGLPNDWVYGLAEGKNGDVWLATEGGMARFANDKWDNWNHAKGIGVPYEKIKTAIEFKNDPGKASVHHAKQKQEMGLEGVDVAYNPNYIVALEVAADGKVWAGTWGGGMTIWDGQKWNNYSSLDGLPGNHVFMLHQDAKGQMWIGTNQGMALWKDGKFKNMTTADGLFGNNVFSMATTPEGGMWIGSFGGVAYLKPR
jgi:ligand-binding sensor domain-containing protein